MVSVAILQIGAIVMAAVFVVLGLLVLALAIGVAVTA
jgi:hypothetical protein